MNTAQVQVHLVTEMTLFDVLTGVADRLSNDIWTWSVYKVGDKDDQGKAKIYYMNVVSMMSAGALLDALQEAVADTAEIDRIKVMMEIKTP